MVKSKAKTVDEYLKNLSEIRKESISAVRNVILNNLPDGIEENMNWGMIVYEVPLSVCPDTYNDQPLMFAALASQKNHMSVYLSGIYSNEDLRDKFLSDYKKTGKRMDIGKSCVRFKKLEDLPLDLIGEAIAKFSMDEFVTMFNQAVKKNKKK